MSVLLLTVGVRHAACGPNAGRPASLGRRAAAGGAPHVRRRAAQAGGRPLASLARPLFPPYSDEKKLRVVTVGISGGRRAHAAVSPRPPSPSFKGHFLSPRAKPDVTIRNCFPSLYRTQPRCLTPGTGTRVTLTAPHANGNRWRGCFVGCSWITPTATTRAARAASPPCTVANSVMAGLSVCALRASR